MKSNVCKINKGNVNILAILQETEKVTAYNGLEKREALYIRLLAEELVSMLPALVKKFDGEFWLENDGADYELHVKMSIEDMDADTRNELIKVSTNNKNAFSAGITGKICSVFDCMILGGNDTMLVSPAGEYGMTTNVDFSNLWSLREYRNDVEKNQNDNWDEFEKSIIGKLADDVIVGVRGRKAEIIIKKKV